MAQNSDQLPLKAVNLGNWLVTEGWMQPSRFAQIPNNDLLDGTQIQLKSTKVQKFLSAENGGGSIIVANRDKASDWETFRLWRVDQNHFNLRVSNKQFLRKSTKSSKVVALSNVGESLEQFEIVRRDGDLNKVRIKATNNNNLFLQVPTNGTLSADYDGGSGWEDTNPSVFIMTITRILRGEYQITNGFGPDRAPQELQNHWNEYITEQDFGFMSSHGINAVRIPVGWWIVHDPNPPKPFVGGSLRALDNAFTWAQNHGMKVIVDLHAAPGSQNSDDHSGSRDGFQEWGSDYVQETLRVIDFLAKRYANNPSLIAIELMNEPLAPGVNLETLKSYYKAGYYAVRKYTPNAYVILSNRLAADPTELLAFAGNLDRVAIDVHYYNIFDPQFDNFTVQQNIDFIRNQRASELRALTKSNDRPLIFVGEWTAAWGNNAAGNGEDHGNFAKVQMEVYGQGASFGWAFWSYRSKDDYWNFKRLIENNWIN